VSARDFLLGLAIIQAFPGPNFNCILFKRMIAKNYPILILPHSRRLPGISRRYQLHELALGCRCGHCLHCHFQSRVDAPYRHHGSLEGPQEVSMGNIVPPRRERIGCRFGLYGGVSTLGDREHRRDVPERLFSRQGPVVGCDNGDKFCGRHVV
jgi:hypothetical protein